LVAVDVDRLLTAVARGRAAIDVNIGEALAELSEGDRALRVGCSCIGDFGREHLGMAPRTAQALARLARGLRRRPLLNQAVREGVVSRRKAEVIMPVARDEHEARWVELAKRETVRALKVRVAAEGGGASASTSTSEEDSEPMRSLNVSLTDSQSAKLDQALQLAGRMLGPGAVKWQRFEAILQEFLSSFPISRMEEEMSEYESADAGRRERAVRLQETLEQARRCWRVLERAQPVGAKDRTETVDPFELQDQLLELAEVRQSWDELFGRLALLLKGLGLWRDLGFASLSHYTAERLGMAGRTVAQRAWLERRLLYLPELREALPELGYEKARWVAQVAKAKTVDYWIGMARGQTCLTLRGHVEAYDEARWGDGRMGVDVPLPGQVQHCALRSAPEVGPTDLPTTPLPTDVQMCAAAKTAAIAPATDNCHHGNSCVPPFVPHCCTPYSQRRWRGAGKHDIARPQRFRLPHSVTELLWTAIEAVREQHGAALTPGECLEVIAEHVIALWTAHGAKRKLRKNQQVIERDSGRCQVPGCSKRAVQAHHFEFRSKGGSDELHNQGGQCDGHHLGGVHAGTIKVWGRAPDGLTWQLGLRPGRPEAAPLVSYQPSPLGPWRCDVPPLTPYRLG